MHPTGKNLRLTATDLANHLGCRHLTRLDHRFARSVLEQPKFVDPALEILKERGRQHEREYLAYLTRQGRHVTDLGEGDAGAVDKTAAAMRSGADVIYQAVLQDGRWYGRADFLVRVDTPSDLGPFSYEVHDTKLARSTRAGTVLQLCLYTDLVASVQGRTPERMHVVKPGSFEPESFRFQEFAAYYRFVRDRLKKAVAEDDWRADPETYPDPVPQCDICRWRPACNRRRREDDHLSLVAGMQNLHIRELTDQGVGTLEQLGESARALAQPPQRGRMETYERLREQARVQLLARRQEEGVFERLPLEEGRGLSLLPEPSEEDVFFDIEGDPFVRSGGLEYLLGYAVADPRGGLEYRGSWALDPEQEKRAFEAFVDAMIARWEAHPGMHVYHFAPYEPAALKRLMGRHGTREKEVDRLLRGGRFVDLHAVIRQGLRASVERYGLKELEPFFGFARDVELAQAGLARRRVEWALELGGEVLEPDRRSVEGYNRDDCAATAALRDWLEGVRRMWEDEGRPVPRPPLRDGEASEGVEERAAEVAAVFDPLVTGLAADRQEWRAEEQARWLLAHCLDYHRRENNVAWWEFFERRSLDAEEAYRDRKAVAGLSPLGIAGESGTRKKRPVHRYRFPEQDVSFKDGGDLHEPRGDPDRPIGESRFGKVHALDEEQGFLDVVKVDERVEHDPEVLFVPEIYQTEALERALLALGRQVVQDGIDAPGPQRAGRDLLLRRPPRFRDGFRKGPLRRGETETAVEAAVRLVQELDSGTLAIQGPPGAGKTFAGGLMIAELARQGKRIGVTAVSHAVIANLLRCAHEKALELGIDPGVVHMRREPAHDPGRIAEVSSYPKAAAALDESRVLGGTAWLWARDDFAGAVDYLFVDEAGQMSLANVLAVSGATANLILLGDPAQLEQPQQGAHPEGTDVSALEHLLDGHKTMPPEVGLFLDRTWRLHPAICALTSELHYEGRLQSRDGLDCQRIVGQSPFAGAGLFHVPVEHKGNQSAAPEEVEVVSGIVRSLLETGLCWVDGEGRERALGSRDVLIVAPYNAQIGALKRALPGLRIGTVDKFQGQEAPVVIYSMTSSSPEDTPRGLSFLYDPNRLNVATSRARCAVILVASPRLFEPECSSPQQMRWANGLCRFREMAEEVTWAVSAGRE